jgi:hypothetical protein
MKSRDISGYLPSSHGIAALRRAERHSPDAELHPHRLPAYASWSRSFDSWNHRHSLMRLAARGSGLAAGNPEPLPAGKSFDVLRFTKSEVKSGVRLVRVISVY